MHMLYEILPVFLFFLAFKFYGIYTATLVGIIATSVQVLLTRVVTSKWDRKQLITMAVFLVFGGMTLYFHNPIFVKWKPTIIFWVFSLAILISQFFTQKPLMQRMMEGALENNHPIPGSVWRNVNLLWALFFILMGAVNIYIAYTCSDETWVNFKFYGITSALFVVSIIQALYLVRFMTEKQSAT